MVLGCFGSNKWTEVAVNPAQPAKDSKFKIFYFFRISSIVAIEFNYFKCFLID
jgi:hypothetical protein